MENETKIDSIAHYRTPFIAMPCVTIKGRVIHLKSDIDLRPTLSGIETIIENRLITALKSILPTLESMGFTIERIDYTSSILSDPAAREAVIKKEVENGKNNGALPAQGQ